MNIDDFLDGGFEEAAVDSDAEDGGEEGSDEDLEDALGDDEPQAEGLLNQGEDESSGAACLHLTLHQTYHVLPVVPCRSSCTKIPLHPEHLCVMLCRWEYLAAVELSRTRPTARGYIFECRSLYAMGGIVWLTC